MGIGQRYAALIERGEFEPDRAQAAVVDSLSQLAERLEARRHWTPPKRSLFARWRTPDPGDVSGVRGLYLWGGVGRGKTRLADLFFDGLTFQDRTRMHFHSFMARIHADLRALGEVEEPLDRIADDWAGRARLVLLDEIHVNDITDAMLLGRLLSAMFARGMTLVTTSNVPPEGLYRDGLQRARFLPAIAQIKRHCTVLQIADGEDHRQRVLSDSALWIVEAPSDDERPAAERLDALFDALAGKVELDERPLAVGGRDLRVRARVDGLLRTDFTALFAEPRSTGDYIELARRFHTVIVDGIPVMDAHRDDEARRFVNLVDEFYDRGTRLVASAEAMPDAIYTGQRLAFEFERAVSRLTEMQGKGWQRTVRGVEGGASEGGSDVRPWR